MLHPIEKRTLGLNFTSEHSANVRVWAPFANAVSIRINDKEGSLERIDFGYWVTDLLDINHGDQYQINLDGKIFPDPASLYQTDSVHGFSQAFNLNSYKWNDNQWKGISPADLIIYELHTGTFSSSGTFDGIAGKLEYLKDLGITAIEIMPVSQFPGTHNWGYDGVFPFAVQNSYGGPEKFQHLIDTCHQAGIAVILDVVYNHFGPEGNYFSAFAPYFTDKYKTPWGQAINFDDEWSDGVRRYFIENALMWFRDFHIDGLRLDAIHAIKDFGATHFLKELKENIISLNELTSKNHLLIAESDLNDVRYINSFEKGGYGIDITWCDEFHHALHSLITKEHTGYYTDFGSIDTLCKSFNDAFVYDGIYSPQRKRTFGNKTSGHNGSEFVVFNQNHDQVGNRLHGERLSSLVDHETLKLVAGATIVSPFIPLFFMGEEYGETNPFLYFTSHSDKGLIRAVRDGRKREFGYLAENGEIPDPQSDETFTASKLNWNNRSDDQLKLFSFYKELIRLRKCHPVFKSTDRHGIKAEVVKNYDCIMLLHQFHENLVISIMNFKDEAVSVDLETDKSLIVLLNSSENNVNGSNTNPENKIFKVNAKSIMILSDVKC